MTPNDIQVGRKYRNTLERFYGIVYLGAAIKDDEGNLIKNTLIIIEQPESLYPSVGGNVRWMPHDNQNQEYWQNFVLDTIS